MAMALMQVLGIIHWPTMDEATKFERLPLYTWREPAKSNRQSGYAKFNKVAMHFYAT